LKEQSAMKHVVTPIVLGASLLLAPGLGFAATPSTLSNAQLDAVTAGTNVHLVTMTSGQPSQTIGSAQTGSATPGNAANGPGSAFDPNGRNFAGTHYAGSNPTNPAGNQPQNSNNPKSVAQYDVAGFQQSQHGH
jgi:hypothetical protein